VGPRAADRSSDKVLAERLGIKQHQLREWERDKVEPTLYNVLAILRALDTTFEDLVDGIE
ncbi:MAG: helix-turn-helix domain-containing protein, partial [Clostridia bacterium]|nr:helix-turn-helix domain-containing protein [Clostridia bacterium]